MKAADQTTATASRRSCFGLPGLTGAEIRRMMQAHRVTIRELKARTGFTLKTIRAARIRGVDFLASLDWWQAITGAQQLDNRRAAQFYQIEMPLLKIVDLQIASQMPAMP